MPRPLSLLLGLLGVALLVLVLLTVLAYGVGPTRASEVAIPGLAAEVRVGLDDGIATIEATTEADLFAGLGYAHALHHPWAMALLRQTATGRLSAWFGEDAEALDVHVRRLGFAAQAERTFAALPEPERALLEAYAAGVNAAFAANRLGRHDAFVLLDAAPEPWRPSDALAVETLLAWLGTRPLAVPDDVPLARVADLEAFLATDDRLRDHLRLGGFEHGLAFAAADTSGTLFFQRIVGGDSALPLVLTADLRLGTRRTVAASLTGTLALPGGFAEERAWAVLLAGSATLEPAFATPPDPTHDRVVLPDGRERLVEARRTPGALWIAEAPTRAPALAPEPVTAERANVAPTTEAAPPEPPPAPEAAVSPEATFSPEDAPPAAHGWWTLRWRGLEAGTDLPAWRALLAGEEPTFALLEGHGLVLDREGGARALGRPPVLETIPGGLLVGADVLAEHAVRRLARADTLALDAATLGEDALSTWALDLAAPLTAALGPADDLPPELRDPAAFLGGWDGRYAPEAIAASIFEYWMAAWRNATGALPDPAALALDPIPRTDTVLVRFEDLVREETAAARAAGRRPPAIADTLRRFPHRADSLVQVVRTTTEEAPDLILLRQALREAVVRLRAEAGPTAADWRWAHVQRARLVFPAHPDPERTPRLGARRFRPVPLADGGHPTALAWGPSPALFDGLPTAAWSAWTSTATWGRVHARFPGPPSQPAAAVPGPSPVRTIASEDRPSRPTRLVPVP